MTQSKKYDYRVVKDKSKWIAEIIRRKTAKEEVVSKRQEGFATKTEATAWAKAELESFTKSLNERNTREGLDREKKAALRELKIKKAAEARKKRDEAKAKLKLEMELSENTFPEE